MVLVKCKSFHFANTAIKHISSKRFYLHLHGTVKYLSIAGCGSLDGRKCLASTTRQEKMVVARVTVRYSCPKRGDTRPPETRPRSEYLISTCLEEWRKYYPNVIQYVMLRYLIQYCQALVPNPSPSSPQSPQTRSQLSPTQINPKGTGADTKILQATHHHHPPTTTFKHEGGVPQKSSENKNGPEWSTLLEKNSGGQ